MTHDTPEIRPIREEEWPDYCRLRADAYHRDLSDLLQHRRLVDLSETRCLFDGGELKATGRLYRYRQALHGRLVPMGGVASLTVPLEERRKGYISRLLHTMLREMRDEQVPVSCLNPFLYPLYRHFGWEHAFDMRTWTLSLSEPLLSERVPGETGRIRRASEQDIPTLNALHETYSLTRNGYQQRSEAYWQERILQHPYEGRLRKTFLWEDDCQQPQAYMVLDPAEGTKQPIKELIALKTDGLFALLRLLEKDNLLETVEWSTEPDFPLAALLNNPRAASASEATFMARIVDVSLAWQIVSPRAAKGKVRLGVRDEICDWNAGTWEVAVEEKRNDADHDANPLHHSPVSTVTRTPEPAQAEADIGTWSQIFYGYLTVEQALFLGKLTVKDENSLNILRNLWATDAKPMMLDFF